MKWPCTQFTNIKSLDIHNDNLCKKYPKNYFLKSLILRQLENKCPLSLAVFVPCSVLTMIQTHHATSDRPRDDFWPRPRPRRGKITFSRGRGKPRNGCSGRGRGVSFLTEAEAEAEEFLIKIHFSKNWGVSQLIHHTHPYIMVTLIL